MKCKICCGEISFESGLAVCKSCNTQQKIDHVFEDVDVMICYIENDPNGRRTKDSLIAQELYQKLEVGKINAFYERVSAANSIGDDIELLRYSFMNKAKIIIVVGTSVENFNAIVEKYGQYFSDKMIMPVCTDINPSDIPKELSQYQALDYSSIGWEKDLQKAVLRILGREKEIDLLETHNKSKKLRIVIISSVIAVVVIVASILLCLYLNNSDTKDDNSTVTTTIAPLTNQQVYENAQDMVDAGQYLEAIELYSQILDYKDSEKQIKKLYDRYDGYYQDDEGCSLYINIIDGKTVEFSLEKTIGSKIVKAEDALILDNNQALGTYIDSFLNEGNISISLSNECVSLLVTTEVKNDELCFGDINNQFKFSDKSDRPPIKTVTKEILLSWMNSLTYVDDVRAAGYELEFIPQKSEIKKDYGVQYKIANTDIVIVATDEDLTKYEGEFLSDFPKLDNSAVVAIIAPTSLICPEKIGMEAKVFTDDDVVYVPNASYVGEMYNTKNKLFLNFYVDKSSVSYMSNTAESRTMKHLIIGTESMMGISSEKQIGEFNYNTIITENENIYYRTLVVQEYENENPVDYDSGRYYIEILSEKEDLRLVCIHDQIKGTYSYYKLNINTEKSSYITEHNEDSYINIYGSKMYNYEKWKRYPDLFSEFVPDTWDEFDYDAMEQITKIKVREKYGLDEDSWIRYKKVSENDNYVLIAIQTDDLAQENKCAWYKADRYKVSVSFIKEGVYVEDYYELPKHLWFKEYPDLAKEFPSVYSGTDISALPYLQALPYSITVNNNYNSIYMAPSSESEYIKRDDDGYAIYLEEGAYTIVEEQFDDEYNLWGKLESGEGWICLSNIF